MKTVFVVLLLSSVSTVVIAQGLQTIRPNPQETHTPLVSSAQQGEAAFPSLKGPGHYTIEDWRLLIDSLWGEGPPTDQKLQVFDTFWNTVDQSWGGFPNLTVNWDSLRNVYRSQVAAGVSRGRFSGILSRLSRALNEYHVCGLDLGIDSTMGAYPEEYPNFPSYRYVPGVPIVVGQVPFRTNFGAGVTLTGDSLALVYSVMPSHPLGLQAGDVILGYDGVPWTRLIKDLYEAELPLIAGGLLWAASPASFHHRSITSAGMNYGLYDTIDILQYSTGDTLHLPTTPLESIQPPYFIATEQLPLSGVAFPDLSSNRTVSWGVLEGTSIGYIYVWDWGFLTHRASLAMLFGEAVEDLMYRRAVQGLIIDFRTNPGGWPDLANEGFKHLFNSDPKPNYSKAIRTPGGDHLDFAISQTPLFQPYDEAFTPTPEIFDHPIAVLTGPNCGSAGEFNAFRLRFHPMVRFFGKPAAGAYNTYDVYRPIYVKSYFMRADNGQVYSNVNQEGFLMHNPFPVDEEVWLTRDGVARGEDSVVKAAVKWITSLTYAHDAAIDRTYARAGLDTICVAAKLTNPLDHVSRVSAIVSDTSGVQIDSLLLHDDGAEGDSSAGDRRWSGRIPVPAGENTYAVSIRTDDFVAGTYRRLPAAVRFTSTGPIACIGDTADRIPQWGVTVRFRLKVANLGSSVAIPSVSGVIRALDTAATVIAPSLFTVGDLAPGQVRNSSVISIRLSQGPSGSREVPFEVSFSSKSIEWWRDTLLVQVSVVGVAERNDIPEAYWLRQNYPNPFNPSTTIEYELPTSSLVKLSVCDVLGREVSVLVHERRDAGVHQVKFDGSSLASGVYVYRLTAGDFVQSRKLVLVR